MIVVQSFVAICLWYSSSLISTQLKAENQESVIWFTLKGVLFDRSSCKLAQALHTGLQIRNANSHKCEKLRSEANSLRFASHKTDLTSLRFRFAIFKTRSLSLRFRNWNRLRIRRAKFAKNSLFGEHFSRFLRAQFQSSVIFKLEYSFENNNLLR